MGMKSFSGLYNVKDDKMSQSLGLVGCLVRFYLDSRWRARVLALLLARLAVAKEHEAVGLGGPEVEGDGARLLGRPLAQSHEGLRGVKGHRVQRGHALALEGHHAAHLGTRRLVSPTKAPPPFPTSIASHQKKLLPPG